MQNYLKEEMKKNIDEYMDYFNNNVALELLTGMEIDINYHDLKASLLNLIDEFDMTNLLEKWEKNKSQLLNGKLKYQFLLKDIATDITEQELFSTLWKKVKTKDDDYVKFSKVYKTYFEKFTITELCENKSNNKKISKGLKTLDWLDEKYIRIVQDAYSEFIQQYGILKKQDIILELSIDPIDFIMMSEGNSWSSCQSFFLGESSYGTLSAMIDPTCVIAQAFLVKDKDRMVKQKLWRALCYTDENFFVMSRQYPAENTYFKNYVYNLVQQNNPSLKMKQKEMIPQEDFDLYYNTEDDDFIYHEGSEIGFNDLLHGNTNRHITFLQKDNNRLHIGQLKLQSIHDILPFSWSKYVRWNDVLIDSLNGMGLFFNDLVYSKYMHDYYYDYYKGELDYEYGF